MGMFKWSVSENVLIIVDFDVMNTMLFCVYSYFGGSAKALYCYAFE